MAAYSVWDSAPHALIVLCPAAAVAAMAAYSVWDSAPPALIVLCPAAAVAAMVAYSVWDSAPPRPDYALPGSRGGGCGAFLRCRLAAARVCIAGCRPSAQHLLCSALATCSTMRSCSQVHSQVYIQALCL